MDINYYGAILFLLIPGILIVSFALLKLNRGNQSKHWPMTDGEIIHSGLIEKVEIAGAPDEALVRHIFRNQPKMKNLPFVMYKYEVSTEQYQSTRKSMSEGIIQDVDRFKVGEKLNIYYDPDNPEYSILEPGNSLNNKINSAIFLGIGGVFIILGLAVMLNTLLSV